MIYGKNGSFGRYNINNFNPSLPISATNPVLNTISIPAAGAYGLTVSPILGSGSSDLTFYCIDVATGNYIYYNPATSTWVNTGHSTGNAYAVNIAAGGGYIYSLVGGTGAVYKYDGTGSGTLLVTVPGFSGAGPYDLVADCEGNWYIFNQTGSPKFLKKYSSSGTLLHSWVVYNPSSISATANAGFAIIGTNLYIDNGWGGIGAYSLGTDTVTLTSTTSMGAFVFADDDLGSCAGAIPIIPTVTVTPSQNNICAGTSVTFSATPTSGGSAPIYQWKVNGSNVGTSSTTYSYTPANGDTVTCTMTSNSPCASIPTVSSTKVTMIVNTLPTAPVVTTPVNLCVGGAGTTLSATGTNLLWYTAASGGVGTTATPIITTGSASTATYYVSQSTAPASGSCESSRATITANVNAVPTAPSVSTPINLCVGSTGTTLSATGTNLKWYTTSSGGVGSTTAPSITTGSASTNTYYVSQSLATSSGGCESSRSSIVANVNTTPLAPTVTTPVNLCVGGAGTTLSATGTNLLWYTAPSGGAGTATTPVITTGTATATTYYVSQSLAASSGGCEGPKASISVNVNALPSAPTVVSSPLNLCIGSASATLSASGANLLWYTTAIGGIGSTTAPTVSASTLGNTSYYVSQSLAASSGACEGPRALFNVTVQPLPIASISSLASSGLIFCKGKTITLKSVSATATGWQWSLGGVALAGATSDTVPAGITGIWGLRVSDVYGCKGDAAPVYLQQDTSQASVLSPTDGKICEEGSLLLTCNPGFITYKFDWQKDGTAFLPAMPTSNLRPANAAGVYRVIVTNNFGCIDTTNTAVITNYARPIKPSIINKNPILEIANIYRYYQWYRNGVILYGANKSVYNILSKGNYYVEVTDANGCLNNSDTINVINTSGIKELSQVSIKLYPNPTHDKVSIETPIPVNIQVIDMLGKLILEKEDASEVNLEDFANGIYLLRISDRNGLLIGTEKIIKSMSSF
ncbi:MAG: T9SS type A sorting domain-containing protein [Chitinophagaceae bacterium]|nr:T9SS type A sorting domain-containing protein [Chitinophagaceae bacterium]